MDLKKPNTEKCLQDISKRFLYINSVVKVYNYAGP